jgi:CBS domain-containing protein
MYAVRDLMSKPAATALNTATLNELLWTLLRSQVSEIYVTDEEQRLLGVVTDYDLLKAQMTGASGDLPADQLMCRNVPTVGPDTQIAAIAVTFRDGRHRQLCVVEKARMIGVICRFEVLRTIAALHTAEQASPAASTTEPESQLAAIRRPKFAAEPRLLALQVQ